MTMVPTSKRPQILWIKAGAQVVCASTGFRGRQGDPVIFSVGQCGNKETLTDVVSYSEL